MKVYYFTSDVHAKSNVQKQRLKISQIDDLNDPYEWHGFDLRDNQFRNAFRAGVKEIKKSFGIISFSASWQNPVMWSHYGDKHKGICLGFDVDDEHLKPVNYTETVTTAFQNPSNFIEFLESGGMDKLLTLKYKDWSYEQEVRVIVPLEERDAETNLYFIPFQGNITLREIILGHRCSLNPSDFESLLSDCPSDVKVFQSRIAFGEFKVVQRKDIEEYSHCGNTPK